MFNFPFGRFLIAGLIMAIVGIGIMPERAQEQEAGITVTTEHAALIVGQPVSVTLRATADTPVNVFTGILHYDPDKLYITSIDYNTSFIDLWAKEPWYNNGDGTLTFTGGTTIPGGFTGTDTILTIHFTAEEPGIVALDMTDVRILQHDGFGTDAEIDTASSTILTIEAAGGTTVAKTDYTTGPEVLVTTADTTTDLNGDGKQSISDISIFMAHLTQQNLRSDFNRDGVVNLTDLSIMNRR